MCTPLVVQRAQVFVRENSTTNQPRQLITPRTRVHIGDAIHPMQKTQQRDLDQHGTILAKATDSFTPLTVHRNERGILNTVRRLQQLTRTGTE